MEFLEVLRARRSVRSFLPDGVPPRSLERILSAIQTAPSAGNLQAYWVYVVQDPRVRRALAAAAGDQGWVADAPVILVFLADPGRSSAEYGPRGELLYAVQDATIAATFAVLAAVNEGLGAGWVGAFDDVAVGRALGVSDLRPVALIPIGPPGEPVPVTGRRPEGEVVRSI